MNDWNSISTAPIDGTPVELMCEQCPEYGTHLLYWSRSRQRWEGKAFTPLRTALVWWDEEAPQPTHWREPMPF